MIRPHAACSLKFSPFSSVSPVRGLSPNSHGWLLPSGALMRAGDRERARVAYSRRQMSADGAPVRIGFVLHVMQVAGAEMLVAEIIRQLGPQLEPVVLCLDGVGQLGETMRREGVAVVELGRRPGVDFGVARRLAAEIRQRRLEVVHAHQYTPFFYTALARMLVSDPTHVIFTEHGRHYPDVVSAARRRFNRVVLSRLVEIGRASCRERV